ncbi:MAG: lytic transglycosylase domain-containing protein [Desulfobulbus sp.]|nr:MAG: lytic transglycosylase domain-containing protein [Desulfobulbus sp.]
MKFFLQRGAVIGTVLFCCVIFCGSVGPAKASLTHYVNKYKAIKVSPEQAKKLSRYNYLINYFCKFSYFQPHHKVNPDFIRALILAESNANPGARSSKDARGLTQITYATGKKAAMALALKPVHFRFVSRKILQNLRPADLYNPAVNILLACYLIAKYNYQHQGKLDLVVSAWNAGEYSVTGNKSARYRETLNHIGKVNGYFIYLLKQKNRRRYAYRR